MGMAAAVARPGRRFVQPSILPGFPLAIGITLAWLGLIVVAAVSRLCSLVGLR